MYPERSVIPYIKDWPTIVAQRHGPLRSPYALTKAAVHFYSFLPIIVSPLYFCLSTVHYHLEQLCVHGSPALSAWHHAAITGRLQLRGERLGRRVHRLVFHRDNRRRCEHLH